MCGFFISCIWDDHLPNSLAILSGIILKIATSVCLQTNVLSIITWHKPFFYISSNFLSIFRLRSNKTCSMIEAYLQPGKKESLL